MQAGVNQSLNNCHDKQSETIRNVKFLLSLTVLLKITLKFYFSPNVCKIREEDVEEDETKETATDREDKDGEGEEGFISSFQLNLESCVEKPNKYQCKKM